MKPFNRERVGEGGGESKKKFWTYHFSITLESLYRDLLNVSVFIS
jgi:hypothetical protein